MSDTLKKMARHGCQAGRDYLSTWSRHLYVFGYSCHKFFHLHDKNGGPQILGTGANFKRVPCLKSCRVNRALVSPLVFHVYVLRKFYLFFTNHMIRNSRNYISDHLATKQSKRHEMLANVTQSQNVPYTLPLLKFHATLIYQANSSRLIRIFTVVSKSTNYS